MDKKTKLLLQVKALTPEAQLFMLCDLVWKANASLIRQSLAVAQLHSGIEPWNEEAFRLVCEEARKSK